VIRDCTKFDFEEIYEIINDAAISYQGIIPADCWKEPYMPKSELRHEISDGVKFFGEERMGNLIGVMGRQSREDVILLRHAYVRTAWRNQGVGSDLLRHLLAGADHPVLIGTWSLAHWAVRFYKKHGFAMIRGSRKDALLKKYWSLSARKIENSVVLADPNWIGANHSS
jgi:N-acetylglutamate synthase-like GNAT family acetyltransferase